MIQTQKYKVIMPNTKFPLWEQYAKVFSLDDKTIFTYDGVIYTSYVLPDHLIEHEKTHIVQQNAIGADNWVAQYLNDKDFRLKQEVEAYRRQLAVVKDRNAKFKLRNHIIKSMASETYAGMVTEAQAEGLLK